MNPFINIKQADIPQYSEVVHSNSVGKAFLNKNQRKLLKTNLNYFSEQIIYKSNSFGYRTHDCLPKDYILALGCSHTYGTGLHESERYTNLLENEIQLPVVNLGAPGTGINFILLNLLRLIYSNYTKPKVVLCQFPNVARLTLPKSTSGKLCVLPQDKTFSVLYKDDSISAHSEICYQIILDMLKREKIKLVSFYFWESLGQTQIKVIDQARDLDHPGPKTNVAIKNYILDKL